MWSIEEYWAYEHDFSVTIPDNARFLSVRTQDGQSFVTFLVDTSLFRKTRMLHVAQRGVYSNVDVSK